VNEIKGVFIPGRPQVISSKMAANVVVVDTSFSRHTVKVTPGTYMTEVLEQACKKFNRDPNNYGLK
jgi:tether containing UBX domain for GLUT4